LRLDTIWLKQALPAIGDAAVDNFFGRVTVQSAAVQQVDSLGYRLLRLDRLFQVSRRYATHDDQISAESQSGN
jgi:hypothetical protein